MAVPPLHCLALDWLLACAGVLLECCFLDSSLSDCNDIRTENIGASLL
jgi:hypothetical protein